MHRPASDKFVVVMMAARGNAAGIIKKQQKENVNGTWLAPGGDHFWRMMNDASFNAPPTSPPKFNASRRNLATFQVANVGQTTAEMHRLTSFVASVALTAILLAACVCIRSQRTLHDVSTFLRRTPKIHITSSVSAAIPSSTLPDRQSFVDFDHVENLPEWLRAFVELNRNQTNASQRHYLRYMCVGAYCGGVADRVKGIIQTFYMAMCTGRQFHVHWETPAAISDYFQPNLIEWKRTPPNNQVAKPLVSMGKAIPGVENPNLLQPHVSYNVKINKWMGDEQILNSTCMQDYLSNFSDGKQAKNLVRMAFWTLFKWSPQVLQGVETIKTQLNITTPYVAIHMRTGLVKNIKDTKRTKRENWPLFQKCAKAFQKSIQGMCGATSFAPIYLASDTLQAKKKLLSLDTDGSLKTRSEMEIYHIDRTRASTLTNKDEAMLDVFTDLKLLVDSTCLVMTPSGYSRLAQWLPPQPRCATYYNDCGPARVSEELAKLKGLCDVT